MNGVVFLLKHIVLWRFKEQNSFGTIDEVCRHFKQELESLEVEGLLKMEVRPAGSNSCHLALYSEFEDEAALDRYNQNPRHQAIRTLSHQVTEDRYVADYRI